MGHAERAHSLLSASNAHIWINCPPSARLGEQFPDQQTEAAAEGTLAHELAELRLRNYFQTVDFGKAKYNRAVNKLKKEAAWADEMLEYTEEYLDYVKALALGFPSQPSVAIEKQVDLSAYVPEGFGTADCVMIGGGCLHVIDFKYGKGVPVSAEGNPQLALYALGSYEAYKILYPVERVELHIVQPRVKDGISSWGCSLEELLAYGNYVRERAELAFRGEGEFQPSENTCRFCRARARCRARSEHSVRLAFSPAYGKLPPLISNEEMGELLKQGAGVEKWLSDLKDCALKECLAGNQVPGWKAVEGRGSREWKDLDAAFAKLESDGIDQAVLWNRVPLTVAQAEKAIGKKKFGECAEGLVLMKPGKPALVDEKDKRQAITNRVTAKEAFKEEERNE